MEHHGIMGERWEVRLKEMAKVQIRKGPECHTQESWESTEKA